MSPQRQTTESTRSAVWIALGSCVLLLLSVLAGVSPANADPVGVGFGGGVFLEGPDGAPVEGATVDVFLASGDGTTPAGSSVTDAAGGWQVSGLAAGVYKFRATAPGFVEGWQGGLDDFAAAHTLELADGQTADHLDFWLWNFWTSAAGTVWADGAGTPLAGVEVTLHPIAPLGAPPAYSTTTDASGDWRIDDLAFGTYRVRFHDPGGTLPEQWYPQVAGPLGAQEFAAVKNRHWSGINAFAPGLLANAWSALADPELTGSPVDGETLTVAHGVWAPQPDAFRCIWFRDGEHVRYPYEGDTYLLDATDVGKQISAMCLAVLPGYASTWRSTAAMTVAEDLPRASVPVSVVVADASLFAEDLHAVDIEVYDASDPNAPIETVSVEAATSNPVGSSAATLELEPGDYRLRAVVDGTATAWWNDVVADSDDLIVEEVGSAGYWPALDFEASTVLHVGSDGVATPGAALIVAYPGANSILGGVFSETSDGVDLFGVVALDPGALMEVFPVGSDVAVATATAGGNGILQVDGLPAGSYEVRFTGEREVVPEIGPPFVESVSQWWPMRTVRGEAETIDFPAEGGHWIGVTGNLNTTSSTTEPGDRAAISGTPAVDQTVALDPALNLGGPPFDAIVERLEQYDFHMTGIRWFADGVAIAGATGPTLKLTPDLEGRSLHAEFTDFVLFGALRESASTIPVTVLPSALPPLNPAPVPTIAAAPVVGVRTTATVGAWGPGATTRTYQWRRDGVVIPGANTTAYTPVGADAGAQLTFAVTASKPGYATTLRTSAPTAPVSAGLLVAPVPVVKGTLRVGVELTVGGAWKPAPVDLAYRWLRNGQPIDAATSPTYVLSAADLGTAISVEVTGTKPGYAPSTQLGASRSPVVAGVITNQAVPSIIGTAKVGQQLSASPGAWTPSGVTLGYEWLRAGVAIPGAVDPTYTLVDADRNKAIKVRVTATLAGYANLVKTSAATLKVVP